MKHLSLLLLLLLFAEVPWRNATNDDNEFYGIYKGHPAESEDGERL